jgi:hypothetical protein
MSSIPPIAAYNALALYNCNLSLLHRKHNKLKMNRHEENLAYMLWLELQEYGNDDSRTEVSGEHNTAFHYSAETSGCTGSMYRCKSVPFPAEYLSSEITTGSLITAQMFLEYMWGEGSSWTISNCKDASVMELCRLLFDVSCSFDDAYDFSHTVLGLSPTKLGYESSFFPSVVNGLFDLGYTPLSFDDSWVDLIIDKTVELDQHGLNTGAISKCDNSLFF